MNEEESVSHYNVERAEILHKGKLFRIIVVPVVAKTNEELKHWLNKLDNPEVMQEIIEKAIRKFDEKEIMEFNATRGGTS